MASKRGIARISARAAAGIVGIAVALAVIGGAALLPLPSFSVTPPSTTVVPVPTSQQRVCPGPLLALAGDASAATAVSAFGSAATTVGTSSASASAQSSNLVSAASAGSDRFGGPVRVTVPVGAGPQSSPLVAGSQTQGAQLEDLAGFAAAACGEATADSWLVGGATTLGETSLVLLANPTAVQATVNLTVYGESGPVSAPGATGIVVAPGTQRVVPLAGLAPSVAAPVVHVETVGGRILATIQQSFVNGLDPEGVDLVAATDEPTTHQVIAGVAIRTLESEQATQSGEAYGENLPAARVLVPGSKAATVRIGAVGEKGTAAGNSVSQTVQPGVVTEIPLDHLADGNFTVTIDSSQPVVVAARTTTTAAAAAKAATATVANQSPSTDFAWFTASASLAASTLVAVAAGPQPVLHLFNGASTDRSVNFVAASGSVVHLSVPAGSGIGVPISHAGVYTLEGSRSLIASVSYTGSGTIASFAINPPGPLAAPIVVYPN